MIDLALLLEFLAVDVDAGTAVWIKSPSHRAKVGMRAGFDMKGYVSVGFRREKIPLHHIVWAVAKGYWPKHEIDHIDLNRGNNGIANLREATHAENLRNVGIKKSNTSGLKGVSMAGPSWRAQIVLVGRRIHIGCYPTKEQAHQAYAAKAAELHGAFARLN